MTAAGGVWATYNREAGWAKFWLILASIFLYYALARQPRENLWLATSLLSLLAAYLALSFLLSPDLPRQSADFEIITKIKRGWLDLRPALTIHAPLPNITAGILAMLIPFPLALGVRAWHERNASMTLLAIVAGGLALFGLLLSSSRGAWLALAVTGGIGLLWKLSQFAAKRVGKSPYLILILGSCLFLVAGQLFWLSLTYPGGPVELANRLPGVPSGGSRLELVHGALNIITDFPFTGGGLGAFAGLYSRYVMVQRDFNTATFHLERAYLADPDHRGITKALGYCYAWAGKLNDAARLLANIPEAEHEMEVYVWWWRTQERGDLADRAAKMAARLESAHARPKGNN